MRCEEIMTSDTQFLVTGQTAQEAARRMRDHGVGFLPVCDPGGRVIGVITDRDVTVRVTADAVRPDLCPVDDVMTRQVIACRPTDDLDVAEQLMARFKKSRVVVTDADGRLRGVISLSDIAERERGERAAVILREVAERETHA